jgi:hypothetical protein
MSGQRVPIPKTELKALLKVSDLTLISKKQLKPFLQVDDHLTDTTNKSLRYAYAKYKAILEAVQLYNTINMDGGWPEQYQKVSLTEIRQIFVSKSVWHAQYIPLFQDISKHEEMVEWLEDNGSGNDEDVWGYRKTAYHFSDLKEWLEEKKKAIGKGKQKEKEKKKKEAKKNLVDKTVKQRK